MIEIRKSKDRGHVNHGWLDSYHTFSFADYQDDNHNAFRALRVINEDIISPAQGFGMHPHRNMEIITYVLDGSLEHKDSLGTGSIISHGEIQKMTAGKGILHSEFNPSSDKPVHLLQIWITPNQTALEPSYEQKKIDYKKNDFTLIVSRDARNETMLIHQDVDLYVAILDRGKELTHQLTKERFAWLQIARGEVELNANKFFQGDGAKVSEEEVLAVKALSDAEFLLFDMA